MSPKGRFIYANEQGENYQLSVQVENVMWFTQKELLTQFLMNFIGAISLRYFLRAEPKTKQQ